MSKMLLSINPEHVENILNGSKKYEYRKVRCKSEISKIVIYSTFPIMRIVGEVEVLDIIVDNPETVWKITSNASGISKHFFDDYFRNKSNAVAYKLGKVIIYNNPIQLEDLGISNAPQSFMYI